MSDGDSHNELQEIVGGTTSAAPMDRLREHDLIMGVPANEWNGTEGDRPEMPKDPHWMGPGPGPAVHPHFDVHPQGGGEVTVPINPITGQPIVTGPGPIVMRPGEEPHGARREYPDSPWPEASSSQPVVPEAPATTGEAPGTTPEVPAVTGEAPGTTPQAPAVDAEAPLVNSDLRVVTETHRPAEGVSAIDEAQAGP